jgi:hypothetical protein
MVTGIVKNQLNGEFKSLKGKAIFSIVDIYATENRWYEKWLCPVSTPLTCVFSPDGALVNLLPELTYESFAYMEKTIAEGQTDSEYYCYNRFGMNKNEYVATMNNVLQAKRNFDAGEDIKIFIDSVAAQVKYPYSLFLKLKDAEKRRDSVSLLSACKELLSMNTPYELLRYEDEYMAAKKVLDPSFDITKEPYLEVTPAVVEIGRCSYRDRKPFFITLKNTGDKPVKISAIETSCSCVSYQGKDRPYVILPHDSIQALFEFHAEQKGNVKRACHFVSDARNPVVNVQILATIQDELGWKRNIK